MIGYHPSELPDISQGICRIGRELAGPGEGVPEPRHANDGTTAKFMAKQADNASKITAVVRRIPRGKVATYGQVAQLAGLPRNARQVGHVLRHLPEDSGVPWHRVVNSQGRISERDGLVFEELQQHELAHEGVIFSENHRLDLSTFQWKPRQQRMRRAQHT